MEEKSGKIRYMLKEGSKVIRMSEKFEELYELKKSFPLEDRRRMVIVMEASGRSKVVG